MIISAPTSADVEAMLETYAKRGRPEDLTPPKLLRKLNHDIDEIVLPAIKSLQDRTMIAYYALDEFSKQAVATDKKEIDAAVGRAKRAESTAKAIDEEIKHTQREINAL